MSAHRGEAGGPVADRVHAPSSLELPSAHLGLTWRPLSDPAELHTLVARIDEHDRVPRRTSAAELAEWLAAPWVDLATDSIGGYDYTGRLRAYGLVEIRPGDQRCVRAFLTGGVHPDWRGGGLGRALVAWMEGRGRQMLAATGRSGPARLAAFVSESARSYRQLYAAAGFSPVRWYTDMRRDLTVPLPQVPVPDGARVVGWSPERDDATLEAHNEAFGDHWGSEPHTPQTWARWAHGAHTMPQWHLVALDEADEVVGYLLSEHHDHEVQGFESGFVTALGVRAPWRRRGLGAALLVEAMRLYRDAGLPYATLDVDTANPTGAHGLYQRLGFEATHGWVLYSVEL